MITVPNALHFCPQCEQEVASGRNTINGEPRICTPCILENVRNKAAMPYLKQSDEPEEQPELEIITKPSRPKMLIVFIGVAGWCAGMGFAAGYMIGRMWPN